MSHSSRIHSRTTITIRAQRFFILQSRRLHHRIRQLDSMTL